VNASKARSRPATSPRNRHSSNRRTPIPTTC
jgi:hypothetical protein